MQVCGKRFVMIASASNCEWGRLMAQACGLHMRRPMGAMHINEYQVHIRTDHTLTSRYDEGNTIPAFEFAIHSYSTKLHLLLPFVKVT
jgi:hypothetical protein